MGMLHNERVTLSANESSNDILIMGLCSVMKKIKDR